MGVELDMDEQHPMIKEAAKRLADAVDAGAIRHVLEQLQAEHPELQVTDQQIENEKAAEKAAWDRTFTMADFGFDPRPPNR